MSWLRVLLGAAWVALLSFPASAAEVWLHDGSRVRGEIIELHEDRLILTSDAVHGGRVVFKMEAVESIVSDRGQRMRIGVADLEALRRGLLPSDRDEPDELGLEADDEREKSTGTSRGNVLVSGRFSDGNSDTASIDASGEYEYRQNKNRVSTRGAFNYTEDDDAVSARNSSGSLKIDRFFGRRVYGFVNTLLENDSFADVRLRSTAGVGVGYQILDPKLDDSSGSMYEEIGASYFDEDVEGDTDQRYATLRASGKYDWTAVGDKIALFHFHEVYQSLERDDDTNVRAETGIRFKLTGELFASFQVNVHWDNTPNDDKERRDTEYLWGLGCNVAF